MNLAKYKSLGMQPQQLIVIEKAIKNNIPKSYLDKYFSDTRFDNLQMEIILKAILNNLDVKIFADYNIPYLQMEKIYMAALLDKKQKDDEALRKNLINKGKKTIKISYIITTALFTLAMILVSIYVIYPLYKLWNQKLFLELTKTHLNIKYAEKIDVDSLIKKHSKENNVRLIKPSIDTKTVGKSNYSFTVTNGLKTLSKDISVEVIDDLKPVLKISKEEKEISEDSIDVFDCKKRIISAFDNVDGDLTTKIFCKVEKNNNKLIATYTVADSSKNVAEDSIKLTIIPKPKEKPLSDTNIQNEVTKTDGNEHSYYNDKTPKPNNTPYIKGITDFEIAKNTDMKTFVNRLTTGVSASGYLSINYSEVNLSSKGSYNVYYSSDDGASLTITVTVN